jgi:hypothetical protein
MKTYVGKDVLDWTQADRRELDRDVGKALKRLGVSNRVLVDLYLPGIRGGLCAGKSIADAIKPSQRDLDNPTGFAISNGLTGRGKLPP